MKLKRLLLILLTLCFAASMVACSSGGSGGKSGKTVEVVWWNAAKDQQPVLEKVADEFNKAHKDIHVTVQLQSGDYYTKLQTVLAANNGPDIMWMNASYFPKFQSKGFFMSYADYIKRDGFDMSNYPKSLVQLYSADGESYGMPKDFDTIGLFYNKELFDKAGVKYPDNTWTWDTLREAAKKLTVVQDGKPVQWGIAATNSTQEDIYPMMVQNGVKLLSDDKMTTDMGSDAAIEAVQFLYDLMYTDKSSPDGQYMTDNDPTQLFQSGKVAMIYSGSWMAGPYYKALQDKVDVAVLPHQKQEGNIIHGIGWVTNSKTKNPDQVWEVVKWLGSKEVAQMQAETGTVIPAFNGTQDAWVKSMPYNLQALIDESSFATPYPAAFDAEWETPIYTHTTNIWLDKEKVAEGMKAAQEESNKVMAETSK